MDTESGTPARGRRYWAIRTDRENRALLLEELRQGRLRQGWGYDPSQDLRLVQREIANQGAWWERLSENQKEVLPHLRMLADAHDSVQPGDWAIVPNLPEQGLFVIVEVVGNYYYEPLKLSSDSDINGTSSDYGHILPVQILTPNGINKYADPVDAKLRGSLHTPKRMWCLDPYRDSLVQLMDDYKGGVPLLAATSGEARLSNAWGIAWDHAAEALRERLGKELDKRFQAAEWEEPIKIALEGLYPGADIRWVGGPAEKGADVVVQIQNWFGSVPWLVIVQVKNYTARIGADVVTQLRTAYEHYGKDGTVLALVVMTTADEMGADLSREKEKLSTELKIPVEVLLRTKMLKILSDGLMNRRANGGTEDVGSLAL
ncbi:MAG TPA: restriction endonuclease [Candidatus Binataceae bacterium]|nr:restriction endonuclease [Candidatus Binataceae bacterium]